MGVHDRLENLKQDLVDAKRRVETDYSLFQKGKENVRIAERSLKDMRAYRNRCHREWVASKKRVLKIDGMIKRLPSLARKYTKKYPFKALEEK